MAVRLDNNLSYTHNNGTKNKCIIGLIEYIRIYTPHTLSPHDKKKVITDHLQNISDNIL